MAFPKVSIDVTAGGTGTILVDGKDVSELVSGVNVRIRAGKLTQIFLLWTADTEIEADGVVTSTCVQGRMRKRPAA